MTILHLAILLGRFDMFDFIMTNCANIKIDNMSSTAGTPLHLAAKQGHLKVVQKLVLSGADFMKWDPVMSKMAKDLSKNQKIVFLLEKYERMYKVAADRKESQRSMLSASKSRSGIESMNSYEDNDVNDPMPNVEDFFLDQSDNVSAYAQSEHGGPVSLPLSLKQPEEKEEEDPEL